MRCHIFIVYESALSDLVVELFFGLFISDSDEGYSWDCERDSAFLMQYLVLVSNGDDYLVEIAACVVRFRRSHFKHPATILKEEWEIEFAVFFGYVLSAQVE